jgi:hypothetical protein
VLNNREGGDGRREIGLPAQGCGVELPHALSLPRWGHGSATDSVLFVASMSGPIMMNKNTEEQSAGRWLRCI